MLASVGRASVVGFLASLGLAAGPSPGPAPGPAPAPSPGPSPFTDFRSERPGKRVKITPADLPAPKVTKSVDNPPHIIKRPKDAWPQAPAGFKVDLYADGLAGPRLVRTAPNGDVFAVESADGVVRILR